MAKSRETYSKKEKEKKKLKKKQEKAEKREERKANSKGGDLEDMIAYVDEFGNISSTPPDPTKKKKVKAEDIVVGVPKQEEADPEDAIRKGKVTFFNESKGFGFIKDQESQESVFVHVNACVDQISENDKVTFEIEKTPRGLSAVGVKLV